MGVSFEKDPDYLMFEPDSNHAQKQSHVPLPAVVGGNGHVLHDLSDYFRVPPEHPTLNDTEPSQIQKHIQAIDRHNLQLYRPITKGEDNAAGLGNLVAVGDNINVKTASTSVPTPIPISIPIDNLVAEDANINGNTASAPHLAVDVANANNEVGNLAAVGAPTAANLNININDPAPSPPVNVASNSSEVGKTNATYSPHRLSDDIFRKPEHFEALPPHFAISSKETPHFASSSKGNPQPGATHFLSPSELSYLPTNWIGRETAPSNAIANGTRGDDNTGDMTRELLHTRLPSNAEELQRVPGLSGIGGEPYVGSSFLQADDVMVVEPVLQKVGTGEAESDASWQPVALALPSGPSIPGPVSTSMKNKRERVSRVGRFACPECHVVFRQTGNLRKHVAEIHQKSKPFRCNVCGNYFSRKHARDTHLKAVHHKLRPFECTLCFKRYKNRSDLNKHMRTVERKEKPHACPICNRAFGERGKLKRHMAIHEKREPDTLNTPVAPTEQGSININTGINNTS